MTLLWMEGFESDQTEEELLLKYDNADFPSFSLVNGRLQGSALEGSTTPVVFRTPDLGTASTFIVGLSYYYNNADTTDLISIVDGTTSQLTLRVVPVDSENFQLQVRRGSTVLATSTNVSGGWNFIEIKAWIHTSTGTYDVRVNEQSVLSGSGVNTANAGFNDADRVEFQSTITADDGSRGSLDDIYICNGSGSVRNDFLGTVVIEAITPDSEGETTEWDTAGSGSHYPEIDDEEKDDDSSYIETADNDVKDLFGFSNLQFITEDILGVQLNTFARVTLAGSRTFAHVFRDGTLSLEDDGDSRTVNSTSYDHFFQVWEQNPLSAADFTLADVNNAQFGVKSIS